MENLAPAYVRLTDEQAQELVLATVARHAESLLRVAHRHSLCADDAHDAYQRGMEILLRRAPTLDATSIHKWMSVVIKHEALEVRRARTAVVAVEDVDYDRHEAPHVSSPEERALTLDRTTRAAEALQRVRPHELRTMWLKALGHSYDEISALTGFSRTKVNRCLAEGRKRFLERFEGIESGEECERWQVVLSAIVDGEATAADMADARPHLQNCPGCRATLRGLHESSPPLAAVLPLGLVGVGAKLSGLVDRLMPGADAAGVAVAAGGAGAGGAGVLGVGGAKLAGLLAAGAVAVGGGTAAVHAEHHAAQRGSVAPAKTASRTLASRVRAVSALTSTPRPAAVVAARLASTAKAPRRTEAARRRTSTAASRRSELKPLGHEVLVSAGRPASPAASTSTKPATPVAVPQATGRDSSRGEFAPTP